MSAALLVLPQVWATAETGSKERFATCRKGPHSLRLVSPASPVLTRAETRSLKKPAFEMAFYRKYTEGMLQRFMTMSLETGRVPSLMGREMFQGNVSHCKVNGFDDVILFVHDVGNCMKKLSPGQQHLLRRIAMQGYTHGETAAMLGMSLRSVVRRYAEALDRMTSLLLERKMLETFVESGASA